MSEGIKKTKAASKIPQVEHLDDANAKRITGEILVVGEVIPPATDFSAAAVLVGIGNLLRIRVAAPTFIAFDETGALGIVSATTSPALELPAAGTYLVHCSNQFMRASANPARVEKIEER